MKNINDDNDEYKKTSSCKRYIEFREGEKISQMI
jgi:hypothetical protein